MNRLESLRYEIDAVDDALIDAFLDRMDIVDSIAAYKRKHGLPIENLARESIILEQQSQRIPLNDECYRPHIMAFQRALIDIAKAYQRTQLNVYLIGMPGSGKSTAARRLGELFNIRTADTDTLIEEFAETSISRIFETEGEAGFRSREHSALLTVAERGSLIVATGGGILTNPDNLPILKSSGHIILLDIPLDTLLRQPISERPLIRSRDDITRLYYERIVDYRTAADAIVTDTGFELEEAVKRLRSRS